MIRMGTSVSQKIATRVLCVLVVLGWLLAAGAGLVLIVGRGAGPLTGYVMPTAALAGVLMIGGIIVLSNWRTCEQCGKFLFAFDPNPWSQGRAPSATTFAGSFQMSAIIGTAIHGRPRCMWCGHLDGDTPKYFDMTHK